MGRWCEAVAVGLLVAVTMVGTDAAVAQEPRQAVLNAVQFQPMVKGQPIHVRTLNDSDENLMLKEEFKLALEASGFTVAEAASALVLTFDTRNEVWATDAPPVHTTTRLRDQPGRKSVGEGKHLPKLMDTGRRPTTITSGMRHRLDADLDDRVSGQRLWSGWVLVEMRDLSEAQTLGKEMVPVLVGGIGKTIRSESFNIE